MFLRGWRVLLAPFSHFFVILGTQTTSKNVQKTHFSSRLRTPNFKKIAGARRERAAPRSGDFFKLGSPNAGARFRSCVSLCYSPSGGATRHASMKSLRTHVRFPLEVPFAVRSVCLSVCPWRTFNPFGRFFSYHAGFKEHQKLGRFRFFH